MKIVIRAGGIGTRLWPYSRVHKPKQLFPLVSDKTMLAETIERAELLVKKNDIFVSMSEESKAETQAACAGIPSENFIIEPVRRDTAAAVGLEALSIAYHDANDIVVGFAADHVVMKPREFVKVVESAVKTVAEYPDSIVAIGILPTKPHTGYGYIEQGEERTKVKGMSVYSVRRFVEKPDLLTATQFIQSETYFWNANIFVWNVSTMLKLFAKYQPKMYEHLEKIASAIGTAHYNATLQREYEKMDTIAVEHAIIEKTSNVLLIPADIGWNDIGDWDSVAQVQPLGRDGNVVKGSHIGLDTKKSLIYGSNHKLIATIGLEDMIIVDTPDVLLVARRDRAQEVKKLVAEVVKKTGEKYL